ncbi:MAG: DUF120 domain-containing protein [Thermoprotei archaeon]
MRAFQRYVYVLVLALEEQAEKGLVRSSRLAAAAGLSQQEAARILRLLEGDGVVRRVALKDGQSLALTDEGRRLLEAFQLELKDVLAGPSAALRQFKALVTSGLGEGSYYMSLEGYVKIMEKSLGFKPFPGTLNLRLEESGTSRERLEVLADGRISPFSFEGRTLGGARFLRAVLIRAGHELNGALVFPERTHHPPDVVEFIAPVRARDVLQLRDGDEVLVRLGFRTLDLS